MELTNPTNLKLKFSEPTSINIGNLTKITIRREDGRPLVIPKIQVRVDVPRSRRRHHQSLRIRNFPVRKTLWKISIKILMPPRRRDHYGLRQTQNIQG